MATKTNAVCILASVSPSGKEIYTMKWTYPRFIHGEVMTHRHFCISGDAELEFDLPSSVTSGTRRVHRMTIREFAKLWHSGVAHHKPSRHNGKFLTLEPEKLYSAADVATVLGVTTLNLNALCRNGTVKATKNDKGSWVASGESWNTWRNSTGTRTFSIRNRLSKMKIRQLNELTGQVQTTTVTDCFISGTKEVFRISAGNYTTVASKDHRFFTDSGWKRLEEIVPGVDKVSTYVYGSGARDDQFKKISGVWVSSWNRQVRDQVALRQSGLCAESGNLLEPDFHIHHVKPRNTHPELAFELSNVVAVNAEEHRKLHAKQGWQIGVALGSGFTTVDSIEEEGTIDTYDLSVAGEFENFFADGIVVHNSRNAASSRAIPTKKMLAQVWSDPAMPVYWGSNQPGMQAGAELTGWRLWLVKFLWKTLGKVACGFVWGMNKLGLHKQIANRPLETWQWMQTIITSTEWDNFEHLRIHPDAQPEFYDLAVKDREARKNAPKTKLFGSVKQASAWHLPFTMPHERREWSVQDLLKASGARCARVSYLTHDFKSPSLDKDADLFDKLVGSDPMHASPIEHQATYAVDKSMVSGNFKGFHQFRQMYDKNTFFKHGL